MINATRKTELLDKAHAIQNQLAETMDAVNHSAGMMRDVMRIVVPMMEHQLELIQDVIAELEVHTQKVQHLPGKE